MVWLLTRWAMARAACLCAPSRMGSCCRPANSILARALRQSQKTLSSMGERECQEQQHCSFVPRLPKSRQQDRAQLLCSGKTQGPGSITEEPFYGQRNWYMRSAEGKPSRAGEVPLQANKSVELCPGTHPKTEQETQLWCSN